LFCTFPWNVYGSSVHERIQSIPKNDKEILEDFFSYMISCEYFGYVLFGEKPIAAGGFDTHFTNDNMSNEGAMKQHRIRLGWETWEKYAELFPSENFILRLSKNPISPSFYWIVLINKETCLKCIKTNLDIFKFVLGPSVTPELLLHQLAIKEDIYRDVLKEHDGLLGILFGYGRHNSMNFQKKNKLFKKAKFLYSKEKKSYSPAVKLTPFNTLQREPFLIDLPRFAEDRKHIESVKLHCSYKATWERLSHIYTSRHFSEITLEKLTMN
jgi:hypothetical protein